MRDKNTSGDGVLMLTTLGCCDIPSASSAGGIDRDPQDLAWDVAVEVGLPMPLALGFPGPSRCFLVLLARFVQTGVCGNE
jgi:hypothetical protein